MQWIVWESYHVAMTVGWIGYIGELLSYWWSSFYKCWDILDLGGPPLWGGGPIDDGYLVPCILGNPFGLVDILYFWWILHIVHTAQSGPLTDWCTSSQGPSGVWQRLFYLHKTVLTYRGNHRRAWYGECCPDRPEVIAISVPILWMIISGKYGGMGMAREVLCHCGRESLL